MITSMMLGRLYIRYMEFEKRVSEVLMIPDIGFFCESETWPRCVASNPWCI